MHCSECETESYFHVFQKYFLMFNVIDVCYWIKFLLRYYHISMKLLNIKCTVFSFVRELQMTGCLCASLWAMISYLIYPHQRSGKWNMQEVQLIYDLFSMSCILWHTGVHQYGSRSRQQAILITLNNYKLIHVLPVLKLHLC